MTPNGCLSVAGRGMVMALAFAIVTTPALAAGGPTTPVEQFQIQARSVASAFESYREASQVFVQLIEDAIDGKVSDSDLLIAENALRDFAETDLAPFWKTAELAREIGADRRPTGTADPGIVANYRATAADRRRQAMAVWRSAVDPDPHESKKIQDWLDVWEAEIQDTMGLIERAFSYPEMSLEGIAVVGEAVATSGLLIQEFQTLYAHVAATLESTRLQSRRNRELSRELLSLSAVVAQLSDPIRDVVRTARRLEKRIDNLARDGTLECIGLLKHHVGEPRVLLRHDLLDTGVSKLSAADAAFIAFHQRFQDLSFEMVSGATTRDLHSQVAALSRSVGALSEASHLVLQHHAEIIANIMENTRVLGHTGEAYNACSQVRVEISMPTVREFFEVVDFESCATGPLRGETLRAAAKESAFGAADLAASHICKKWAQVAAEGVPHVVALSGSDVDDLHEPENGDFEERVMAFSELLAGLEIIDSKLEGFGPSSGDESAAVAMWSVRTRQTGDALWMQIVKAAKRRKLRGFETLVFKDRFLEFRW